MKTKIVFGLILSVMILNIKAQQVEQMSLRMLDQMLFNPAVSGSSGYPEIKLHHRSQWIGFSGAPRTSVLSYHYAVSSTMGVGGYFINDITGPLIRKELNLSYAYHIPIKPVYWSLGLSGSFIQYRFDGSDIDIKNPLDMSVAEGMLDVSYKPDFSFGTYIYNDRFYVGFSALQLFTMNMKFEGPNNIEALMPLSNHMYLMGGVNLTHGKDLGIEPSLLVSTTMGNSPVQIDANIKFDYKRYFTSGFSYRYGDSFLVLVGFRFERFFVAYSYDIVVSSLRKSNSGSHEILLAFNLPPSTKNKRLYDLKGKWRGQIKRRLYQ